MTTLEQSLKDGIGTLTKAGTAHARLTVETLLMSVLGCDRAFLFAHPERVLLPEEAALLDAALARRVEGVPTQYITGHQEFWGMDLLVSPAVLIPRPETEHLIEVALEKARGLAAARIVDVGTGSGCIALALAKDLPLAKIDAVDNSAAALAVARGNSERLGLQDRVRWLESDLLNAFPPETEDFDMVVSNPPYVSEGERETLEREVRDFEPQGALFAGRTGLDVIERLIPQAQSRLKHGGWLLMEIGHGQKVAVERLLHSWMNVNFVPDLQGIARVVVATRS